MLISLASQRRTCARSSLRHYVATSDALQNADLLDGTSVYSTQLALSHGMIMVILTFLVPAFISVHDEHGGVPFCRPFLKTLLAAVGNKRTHTAPPKV